MNAATAMKNSVAPILAIKSTRSPHVAMTTPIVETINRCRQMAMQEMGQGKSAKSAEARAYVQRLDEMNGFLRVLGTMLDLAVKLGPKGMERMTGMMVKAAG